MNRKPMKAAVALSVLLAAALWAVPTPRTWGNQQMLQLPKLTTWVDARVLAANVAETVTVPTGCDFMVLAGTAVYYVRNGGTAVIPVADVTDGTAPMLSPAARRTVPGETFSIIAPATTIVTMECYQNGGANAG
jgi:hypothetical protein